MREYVLTLLAAAAVSYLLTPLVRRFAIAIGAMHAARDRDVHVVPTPLLGGFAMYAGLAAGLVVASQLPSLNSVFAETNIARGLLLAGGLIVVMGFVDDRWGMGVISKLAGQVAAGVILVWSGAEVTWLPAPGGGTLGLTSDQQIALTILVVVVTINAVNFIDGLDGLAAGIVGIGAAAFFAYYYTLTHRLGLPDQAAPALASAVLAGTCLGFLPHNYHPARIFMGDTGAMLIGLLLAYAPISSLASLDPGSLTDPHAYAAGTVNRFGAILPLLLPAAILLIPYTDLLMAVFRRTRAGMSPFSPDRKHLHHRMLDIGHSHRASVLIMYLWAALFAGSVVWLSIVQTPLFVLVIVTVGAMLVLLFASMPRLRPWGRPAVGARAAGVRAAGVRPAGARAAGARAAGKGGAASAAAPSPGAPSPPPAEHEPVRPALVPTASPAPVHHVPARPAVPAATSHRGASRSSPPPPALPTPHASFHPAPLADAPAGAGPVPGSSKAPPQPAAPSASVPPWPGGPQEPAPSWPGGPQEASPPRPGRPSESSPPWPPAPPAPPLPPT
jgi:UDP-GlcNAc:undecaprenyl-phosphate/decaprenyl-phosphate GlcNAc-1-phosphate transferase